VGVFNWELERDLNLAKQGLSIHVGKRPGPSDVARLEAALQLSRASCPSHSPAPPPAPADRCWKCGITPIPATMPEPRPSLAKARRRSPLQLEALPADKKVG